ncbi:MAG TPA: ATP-binding protein [Alloiococcus sp.]|nr:ATP-binding protein [Alloiococcus sp.]
MKRLRKRMLLYFTLAYSVLTVILLLAFIQMTESQILKQQENMLSDQMAVISRKIEEDAENIRDVDSLKHSVSDIATYLSERMTIIDPNGEIILDTTLDVEEAENHADREEFIKSVEENTVVTASRESTSTGDVMFYAAEAIYNPSGELLGVVRISNSMTNFREIVFYLSGLIVLSLIILIAVTFYMTFYWTNKIKHPIDELRVVMNKLSNKDYQTRYTMNSYEEINELGHSINYLAENLESQLLEIQQNDRRLTTLLENIVVGVILLNEDREIKVCNPAVNEILSTNVYGYLGRDYTDIIQSSEITRLVDKAIKRDKPQNKEVVLYLQSERVVDVNVIPIINVDEENNYAVLLYDITEIKRLEQVRTDFVANASHELRTPITALKGFSETLLDGAMNDPELLKEFLEIMLKESTRLDTMVHDILQLSRLEQRPNHVAADQVNVEDTVRDAIQILYQKAETKQIDLTVDVKTDLIVNVNQDELKQVIINLIGNAISYTTEKGYVKIVIDTRGKEGIIEVKDNGIGIPQKEQERIFERFYRVDKARSRNAGGTGLGLSIVKWLVDGMDGWIELESMPQEGSTFRVWMPIAENKNIILNN